MTGADHAGHTYAIPVWNRKELVLRAVDAVLAAGPSRVCVIDNHSDDGTWEALTAIADERVRVLRNPRNIGLFGNLNRCLEEQRSPTMTILCSDDLPCPGFAESASAILAQEPETVLVAGYGVFVDLAGNRIRRFADHMAPGLYGPAIGGRMLAILLRSYLNLLNYPSGWCMRSHEARANGIFDKDMRLAGDIDWSLRLLTQGSLRVVAMESCAVTLHAGQLSAMGKRHHAFTWVREFLTLARRHHRHLAAVDDRSSAFVVRSLAGMSLVWSVRFALKRRWRGCRLHRQFFLRADVFWAAKLTALWVFLLTRVRLRFFPGCIGPA